MTAFAVYLRTLAPGLVAAVDTPMFQFIGRVLGVPHNPGYPWYVLLTYAFSFLPIGSLPYRINLFSAVFGALTVSLVCLAARRLDCGRIVSVAAALGLAFGGVFWSQAIIAEVYTMYTAILAAMLLALLAWGRSRRPAFFYAAVAAFAAGLGHHTTIAAFAPAVALYAVLVDRRFVLRPRTLLIAAAIVCAGLLPYSYVLIRSTQPGVYAESRASTLPELMDVILARQFQDRLFAFYWLEILLQRIPALWRNVVLPELTWPGVVLSAAGLLWLLFRRTAEGLLLIGGGSAIALFALVYRVVDTAVFLMPVFLVLWLAAAVGAARAVALVSRWQPAARVAPVLMLGLPAWHLAQNFEASDRSRDTATAVHLDALFEALPARTAIVHEDFLVDRLVMFKLLADGAARGRRIEIAPRDAGELRTRLENGDTILAFLKSAIQLRREGLGFGFRPVPLFDGPLPTMLERLPDDAIVALAVPSSVVAPFGLSGGAVFTAIGGPASLPEGAGGGTDVVLIGVRGARAGARLQAAAAGAQIGVAKDRRIGGTDAVAPSTFEVRAADGEAVIRQDSRDVVRTRENAAAAIWMPDGRLLQAMVLGPAHGFRTPVRHGPLSVYRLERLWDRHDLRPEARVVADAFRSGSAIVRVPANASVVVYAGSDRPLTPRVVDRTSNRVSIGIAAFEGAAATALEESLEADAMGEVLEARPANTYRIEVNAPEDEAGAVLLAAGGVPRHAVARVVRGRAPEAALVEVDLSGLLRTPDERSEVLLMARDEQSQLIGAGWSRVDWDVIGPYRWLTAPEADVLLPVSREASALRVQAFFDERRGAASLALRINGAALPAHALRRGWHVYDWALPAGAIRRGINEMTMLVERENGESGRVSARREIAVSDIRLIR